MKKKIVSLLLVVTLMMSLTIASFANTGTTDKLRLYPDESEDLYIYGKHMNTDDDLSILVSLENYPNAQFLFEVYDRTTSQRIILKSFSGESTYHDFKDIIDPTHDYKILVTNIGNSYFRGHIFIVVD